CKWRVPTRLNTRLSAPDRISRSRRGIGSAFLLTPQIGLPALVFEYKSGGPLTPVIDTHQHLSGLPYSIRVLVFWRRFRLLKVLLVSVWRFRTGRMRG